MQAKIEKFMALACRLALKARGQTFPNPLVGAVIVKNGRVVGKGFHQQAGTPHAEINALRQAGSKARGAALFCTFEPCAHQGLTGPCVSEIIKAGIKEVYAGMIDPNPLVRGRGLKELKKAGLRVRVGFLENEINRINEPFIKSFTEMRPLVTVKFSESLDGKIATKTRESKWITSQQSRRRAHEDRRFYDAIMVGLGTVLADDPGLEPAGPHRLAKIIVDSDLSIPLTARLLKTNQPVIIAAVKKNKKKEKALEARGTVVVYTKEKRGQVDLRDLLKKLHGFQIRNILVEGGAELIGSFLDERLADKALIFIAPRIIGGRQALTSVAGEGVRHLDDALCLENIRIEKIAQDILIQGDLKYSQKK